MSPEALQTHRDQIAYIDCIKTHILSDARALYATQGVNSHKLTYDVITSSFQNGYTAHLIVYHDLTTDNKWTLLQDGLRCRSLCLAFKMLWDGIQMAMGNMRARMAERMGQAALEQAYVAEAAGNTFQADGMGAQEMRTSRKHARSSSALS